MSGQLQLTGDATATSAEDKYILNDLSCLDYFQVRTNQKTAPEIPYSIELDTSGGNFGPGETMVSRIYKQGSFLTRVWIDIYVNGTLLLDNIFQATPRNVNDFSRFRHLAYRLISSITLVLSHRHIQTLDPDWMCIWAELSLDNAEKEVWMTLASGVNIWESDTDLQQLILSIPIPFFFNESDQSLPLFLLDPSDLDAYRIEVKWAQVNPLTGDTWPTGLVTNARMYAEYKQVYSGALRTYTTSTTSTSRLCLERPISLVDSFTFVVPANASRVSLDLSPMGMTLYKAYGAMYFTLNVDPGQELDDDVNNNAINIVDFYFAGGFGCDPGSVTNIGPALALAYNQGNTPSEFTDSLRNLASAMNRYNRCTRCKVHVVNHKNQKLRSVDGMPAELVCDLFPKRYHTSKANVFGLQNIHMIPFEDYGIEDEVQFAQYVSLPALTLELDLVPVPVTRNVRVFLKYARVLLFNGHTCSLEKEPVSADENENIE